MIAGLCKRRLKNKKQKQAGCLSSVSIEYNSSGETEAASFFYSGIMNYSLALLKVKVLGSREPGLQKKTYQNLEESSF